MAKTSTTPSDQETRTLPEPVEVRQAEDGSKQLRGYAALFNTPAQVSGWEERIAPGAFTDAIQRDDVRALFNHDPNYVLGRTPKTLRLEQDSRGLRYEVDLPETSWAADLHASILRGDINQSSFAFVVEGEEWNGKSKPPVRTITKVRLYDVSPVTYPAYAQTTVSARAEARAAACEHETPDQVQQTAEVRYRYASRRLATRPEV